MNVIKLPARVSFQELFEFQAFLSRESHEKAQVILDFGDVEFYEISAIGLLLAHVHGLRKRNVEVDFQNLQDSFALTYLQRINFFDHCDFQLEERFIRYSETGRFVPFYRVGRGGNWDEDKIAEDIADCLFPELVESDDLEESGIFDWSKYAISELIRNVSQHSQAYGFVGAQNYVGQDSIQIVVADCGIGILGSFSENASRFFTSEMDDLTAVRKALEVKVSSRDQLRPAFGETENAGVGLTLTVNMVREIQGRFVVASGKAFVTDEGDQQFGASESLMGTFCALSLKRSRMGNFYDLLTRVKTQTGLLPPERNLGRFFK